MQSKPMLFRGFEYWSGLIAEQLRLLDGELQTVGPSVDEFAGEQAPHIFIKETYSC